MFRDQPPDALLPQASERLIHDDAGKPGGETGVAAETFQMTKCADIGFLNHVLGFAVIANDAAAIR